MLKLDSGSIDVHWENIVHRGLIPRGVTKEKQVTQLKEHTAIVNE